MDLSNIREVLESHHEDLSIDDLLNIDQERAHELNEDEPNNEERSSKHEKTLQFNELFRNSEAADYSQRS